MTRSFGFSLVGSMVEEVVSLAEAGSSEAGSLLLVSGSAVTPDSIRQGQYPR